MISYHPIIILSSPPAPVFPLPLSLSLLVTNSLFSIYLRICLFFVIFTSFWSFKIPHVDKHHIVSCLSLPDIFNLWLWLLTGVFTYGFSIWLDLLTAQWLDCWISIPRCRTFLWPSIEVKPCHFCCFLLASTSHVTTLDLGEGLYKGMNIWPHGSCGKCFWETSYQSLFRNEQITIWNVRLSLVTKDYLLCSEMAHICSESWWEWGNAFLSG